jgi:acyl-CoA thioester hydrolase
MTYKTFYYPITIKEMVLDSFDHVNNAQYLVMFEEARWDLVNQHGYGLEKIRATGLGPTILEIKLRFMKELVARDRIMIETQMISYESKIGKISQRMLRLKRKDLVTRVNDLPNDAGDQQNLENFSLNKDNWELCCQAEFTIGLFDIHLRKLVLPTEEWLNAVGMVHE